MVIYRHFKMFKLFLSLIIILTACSLGTNDCQIRDISGAETEEEYKLLEAIGHGWMKNAKVCSLGEFVVAVPDDNDVSNRNIIFVFKKGKPVFYRQNSGTYVYSPKLKDASFEKILVHIWHGGDDDEVNRLWYQTVGKEPQIMVYDMNFDGQPDTRTIWKGHEIVEMYIWENNGWQRKK